MIPHEGHPLTCATSETDRYTVEAVAPDRGSGVVELWLDGPAGQGQQPGRIAVRCEDCGIAVLPAEYGCERWQLAARAASGKHDGHDVRYEERESWWYRVTGAEPIGGGSVRFTVDRTSRVREDVDMAQVWCWACDQEVTPADYGRDHWEVAE